MGSLAASTCCSRCFGVDQLKSDDSEATPVSFTLSKKGERLKVKFVSTGLNNSTPTRSNCHGFFVILSHAVIAPLFLCCGDIIILFSSLWVQSKSAGDFYAVCVVVGKVDKREKESLSRRTCTKGWPILGGILPLCFELHTPSFFLVRCMQDTIHWCVCCVQCLKTSSASHLYWWWGTIPQEMIPGLPARKFSTASADAINIFATFLIIILQFTPCCIPDHEHSLQLALKCPPFCQPAPTRPYSHQFRRNECQFGPFVSSQEVICPWNHPIVSLLANKWLSTSILCGNLGATLHCTLFQRERSAICNELAMNLH